MISRLVCMCLLSLLSGCQDGDTTAPIPLLQDVTTTAGLSLTHDNGSRGNFYYIEILSGGGGWLDFDGDGDLDLYVVHSGLPDGDSPGAADQLFRNNGIAPGQSVPTFTDVSEETGISLATSYGLGIATGDYNNDGWVDIHVTQLGKNRLWRNEAGLRFADVTDDAGLTAAEMSTSAIFVDVDEDGWLDLYVANYLDYTVETDKACTDLVGVREYCGPQSYLPGQDRLYRNLGDGRFKDWNLQAGINEAGAGLGVVAADLDRNGRIDIYVANDQAPNFLWLQQDSHRFTNEAMLRGSAVDAAGKAEASMGLEVGDLDGDGDEDLFMTHLIAETNTAYLNDGSGFFFDAGRGMGLGASSLPWTGFGTVLFDYDNDGWLDIVVGNGAVRASSELKKQGDPYPYGEPNLLYRNDGEGRFRDITELVPDLQTTHVTRGIAPADFDNDGDTDLVVFNSNGPLQVLTNQIGHQAQWLGVEVLDSYGKPALGAEVRLETADGKQLFRRVRTTVGYLTAGDHRLRFGLGDQQQPVSVEVRWVDETASKFDALIPGRYHRLQQAGASRPATTHDHD